MPRHSQYAVIGVLVALLASGFLWKYGDTTDPAPDEQRLARGWREANLELPAVSDTLQGIDGTPDGIPRRGTYVVNLWASFCAPCKHEMPWLERLHTQEDVAVLGVTRDNLLAQARKVIAQRSITYPNVRDELGDFAHGIGDAVPPQFLPSTLIVVDGTITWTHLGPFDSYADLRSSVTERL